MKFYYLSLVGIFSAVTLGDPFTYWVHQSCSDPKFNGAFDAGLKDAFLSAERALMRLDANPQPYMDEIFQIIFRRPKTDHAAFQRVKHIFQSFVQMQKTDDQLRSDIRFYCDNDASGPGKRWTITPDDPDDPPEVKNSVLDRVYKSGDPENKKYQQWQDETDWIRMSQGSMGCADGKTNGETQHTLFSCERTPQGINAERSSITMCDIRLEKTELTQPVGFAITSTFAKFSQGLGSDTEPTSDVMTYMQILSMDILHEFTHIGKDGFRTVDKKYVWSDVLDLPSEIALDNAESYAFYAFLARFADIRFRIQLDGVDDAAKLQAAKKAVLVYDENLERVGGEDHLPTSI